MPSGASFTGGARVGDGFLAWNFSAPFASLTADEKSIEIRITFTFWKRAYTFPREAITSIEEYDGFFSRGLRICCQKDSEEQSIIFWFKDRATLKKKLGELGYSTLIRS